MICQQGNVGNPNGQLCAPFQPIGGGEGWVSHRGLIPPLGLPQFEVTDRIPAGSSPLATLGFGPGYPPWLHSPNAALRRVQPSAVGLPIIGAEAFTGAPLVQICDTALKCNSMPEKQRPAIAARAQIHRSALMNKILFHIAPTASHPASVSARRCSPARRPTAVCISWTNFRR